MEGVAFHWFHFRCCDTLDLTWNSLIPILLQRFGNGRYCTVSERLQSLRQSSSIVSGIPMEEEDEPKEEIKLECHPWAEPNTLAVNDVAATITSHVHNMVLGVPWIALSEEFTGLPMHSAMNLGVPSIDVHGHSLMMALWAFTLWCKRP